MKTLVAVKRVIDFNIKVRVKADGSGIETDNLKMSMNPFDEIALEEAVRQKELGKISNILVVSIGEASIQETLRTALARGADSALGIVTSKALEPINIAKILKVIVEEQGIEFILLGKQAIDDDCNQTGQMLAGLLNWSQGTYVSQVDVDVEKKCVKVLREIDEGLETLLLQLPSVITVDLRLNEPRYISLPNVMKAKTKPLSMRALEDLNVEIKPHLKRLKVEAPPDRPTGIKLNTVQELVHKLRNEAKVI